MGDELHSFRAFGTMAKLGRRLGRREGYRFGADMVASSRGWLESRFEGPEPAQLLAPWVLHTGLDPEAAGGGFLTLAIAATPHAVGMPVVKGGSDGFSQAFRALIESRGGSVRTGAEVERIVVRGDRVAGVRVGGEEIGARRAVIANVTPTQLHGRLLDGRPGGRRGSPRGRALPLQPPLRDAGPHRPESAAALARRAARLGPDRPHERGPRPGLAGLRRGRGRPPAAAADRRRRPADRARPLAGAGGRRPALAAAAGGAAAAPRRRRRRDRGAAASGREAVVDAYVERVLDRIRPHVEDLDGLRLQTVALPPPELERRNPNLVGGDIYAGDAALDQSYFWRPLPGHGSHATAVEGLYQCGASTYPGPGLNAASGRIAAKAALAAAEGRGPAATTRRLAARLSR